MKLTYIKYPFGKRRKYQHIEINTDETWIARRIRYSNYVAILKASNPEWMDKELVIVSNSRYANTGLIIESKHHYGLRTQTFFTTVEEAAKIAIVNTRPPFEPGRTEEEIIRIWREQGNVII